MYLKLDHMFPIYMGSIGLEPVYTIGVKFERDAYKEYKLYRRKCKLLDKER